MSKARNLDQFYTSPNIAKQIIDNKILKLFPSVNDILFLEPSAGTGAFSDYIINKKLHCMCFDLEPKKKYIKREDFFNVDLEYLFDKILEEDLEHIFVKDDDVFVDRSKICVLGNPPFGKNSSLAIKFFRQATELADTICFILPKTFKKQSVWNKLPLDFRCKYQKDLPKNSFIFENESYDVPCVFQIWQRSKIKRKITTVPKDCKLFEFTTKKKASFGVRRVGGRSGTAFESVKDLSESSNYFLKVKSRYSVKKIIKLINSINFKDTVNSTAGVRSLSKGELIQAVERNLDGY